jgi:CheY-like chemotaxis protein
MVMICESDSDLISLFQQTLGSKYSIIAAVGSGRECLGKYIDEKAKGNQIDVLIVDYHLQDLPGDIIAATVGELSGHRGGSRKGTTNTILICGQGVDEELINDLKSKNYIIETIEKPVSSASLLNTIERISSQ